MMTLERPSQVSGTLSMDPDSHPSMLTQRTLLTCMLHAYGSPEQLVLPLGAPQLRIWTDACLPT